MFYNVANAPTRLMLNASVNGTLLDKSPEKAFDILNRITNNDYQISSTRLGTDRKISRAYELDSKESVKVSSPPAEDKVRPPPPFPQWLKKRNDEIQFKKFVDVDDQLHINVFLLKAIEQMSSSAKFLKDVVTKKRKVRRIEIVATIIEYSLAMNKLSLKQNDPNSFIIPCFISEKYLGKALCDLESSVNMMPKSIFLKLGMDNGLPTTVILQLAD
ncbi:uncharacterized protein LOC120166089 [Hibiscus syriacus]|uniref:uncharacterized protein LOC120166089 n=1 Tax=Hibiscus syriacus TaxID=106335 RepID=UPI0019229C99|nr:uncharacterized protein LOC120166089 [Hibiscus syriacus]